MFLQAEPEYSQPRNTANLDATWRISDTTAVLASAVQNLDYDNVATANIGVAVTRDERLTYFIGTRYISELNSNQATVEASYKLDRKYSVTASESIDLAQSRNVYYEAQIIRQFDNFAGLGRGPLRPVDEHRGVSASTSAPTAWPAGWAARRWPCNRTERRSATVPPCPSATGSSSR